MSIPIQANNQPASSGVAIIGMSGRFPDAKNINEFWENLCNGVNSVRPIPDAELELSAADEAIARDNPKYVKMAAPIDDADKFDAAFFGIFPKKAITMDPHQRVFLECCWHALEDGGYVPETYAGSIGVFAGCYMNTYLLASLRDNPDFIHDLADVFHGGSFQNEIGFEKDYLATQVSYLLNLRGPALTIQTACSTSLVCIATACQSLMANDCDMALAGAATLRFPQMRGYLYEDGGMMSPDGTCKTFDARANGTIFGNGVAAILLKRLEDAIADGDEIYATIRGWGLNNDGDRKPGYTAPSVDGQVEAVAKAQAMAGIEGDTITYIEAHGTGTSLGDPIEIDALSQVFRRSTEQNQYCAIGSVKTNVGHLDCVAGIAGLIKTALAIKHGMIPASLHFETPNPRINFVNSPFYVNTELSKWEPENLPRRAGISSFGVGGTNAHVVLEEAPSIVEAETSDLSEASQMRPYQLLTLSARSDQALEQAASDLAHHLKDRPSLNLADVAHTLNTGRRQFAVNRAIVAANAAEAIEQLSTTPSNDHVRRNLNAPAPSVAFMLPGQGSQYANMGRALYESEQVYRDAFDHCAEILEPHVGANIKTLLFIDGEPTPEQQQRITETAIAQPSICAVEYSLGQLWLSRNVHPAALIGHSVGEFSAACLAGILSVEDAMTLVAMRGQMMQSLPAGLMVAVRLPESELLPYMEGALGAEVTIGAINSPQLCVISGPNDAVSALQAELEKAEVVCRPLRTSHAFHSKMMDPILPTFQEAVSKMQLNAPQIPVVSTVTGTWMTDEEAQSPEYWTANLRETVRFSDALANLFDEEERILLEVGPGQALTSLARQHPAKESHHQIFASSPHPKQALSDAQIFSETTGRLWSAGIPVDFKALYAGEERQRLHLPGYPFERKRFWYDIKPSTEAGTAGEISAATSMVPAPATNGSTNGSTPSTSQNGQAQGQIAQPVNFTNLNAAGTSQRIVQQQLELMARQLATWHQRRR